MSDWNKISLKQFIKDGGSPLLNHYKGSLTRVLQAIYPSHKWTAWKFSVPHQKLAKSMYSKDQYMMFTMLQSVSTSRAQIHCPVISFPYTSVQP